MPRIDPLSLLKCLSVLLGPTGGIKSKEEVHRLANLMTKFSKKLVSKCIYIQILKTTNAELLSQFMGAGGWNLIHMWLTDGILAKNWALIQELLELLLLCPVDIERLKSNNCPKLIKGLSKEGSQEAVQILAGRLVEQWLKIVKGEAAPNSLPPQITTTNQQITIMGGQQQQQQQPSQQQQVTAVVTSGQQRHQTADGIKIESSHDAVDNTTTIQVQDLDLGNSSTVAQDTGNIHQHQQQYQDQIHIQPVQLQIINKTMPGQTQPTQIKKQSFVVVSSASSSHPPTVPVYKITIRDGKQVLTKVETDASNITNIFNDSAKTIELNGELKQETVGKIDSNNDITAISECRTFNDNNVSDKVSCEVKQTSIICKNDNQNDVTNVKNDNDVKDIVGSDGNNKSSDKENRDSHKKDDKSISNNSSSSDNKKSSSHHSSSKSSSKHGSSSSSRSSSNSHRSSSHRSSSKSSSSSSSKSSRDKDRHSSSSSSKHSSSSSSSSKSKSDRDKERDKEKEKLKKDQAEKDKATLEKVQAPSLGSKFGKIPKKKSDDEKTTDPLRKSSTDSRDSSKENKDKGDSKKSSPSNQGVLEKKNISASIENKKNTQETVRPKTVKTFNSKFRSTGLEEEVKPPPPRSTAGKKTTQIDKKVILPKLPSLKRTSPLRDTGATADKRAKLVLDSPVTPPPDDNKKGAIKLIPPKPKPMVLQESDMFMDALTASTKNKEPRKRKRRTSISKDTDSKKSEGANSILGDITRDGTSPPSSSPSGGDERSSLSLKPEFKFYQDTLETDEDKDRSQDDKDDESPDEKNRDQSMDDDDDDDERSRTPTCDDDSQDDKAPASPDDPEDKGRKPPGSPNAEIRYIDGLRSVLLLQKRKGPKKSLKWKTELESVRYFELDETERVNVTKTFTDMKQMEKQNEREAFQMARKLSTEDLMEERTRWNILIPIDLPAALVEPGKDSKEKDIQYAREKGILQALYFNRSMIPDSPAEPDEERHHLFTDAKTIPLDDLTGNKESEKDFTSMPWPEPKPQLAPVPPVPANILYPPFPQHNQPPMPGLPMQPLGMGPMIGPMSQQMPPSLIPPMNHMTGGVQDVGAGAGGWRTGDGKVVVPDISSMNNMPNMPGNIPPGYPPPIDTSIMPPGMMPPPGMFNQQDGYPGMMPPDDGNYGHMPNNFQGPGMFVPGPNFQTGPPPPPPRGAVMNPMHGVNRGRGGPGWFRGGVGPIRGASGGGGGVGGGGGGGGGAGWGGRGGGGGGWRGNGKQPPVCRQFTKNGYCRAGDKCQYLHPGLNCPPF